MEGRREVRRWDKLDPDTLGLIFGSLSAEEVLTVVTMVCKTWNEVVKGPYCWQDIDIEGWCYRCRVPGRIEKMLQMLMNRNCGSLHKLCAANLSDGLIFSSIAGKAGSLHTLRLPGSEVSDSTMEQISGKLSSIAFLDLSYCEKISSRALDAIGNKCKSLVGLRRNMHPLKFEGRHSQDEEARAIARTMPGIKRLEMAYNRVTTESVLEILESCKALEFLDLSGCWDVEADSESFDEKFTEVRVLWPQFDSDYPSDGCFYYSESGSSSDGPGSGSYTSAIAEYYGLL